MPVTWYGNLSSAGQSFQQIKRTLVSKEMLLHDKQYRRFNLIIIFVIIISGSIINTREYRGDLFVMYEIYIYAQIR